MTNRQRVREWMFRRLIFEAEADQLRAAGIRIGTDSSEGDYSELTGILDPFGVELRGEALRMTRIYALIYCFENSVRSLLSERMRERHGSTWWGDKVSKKIRDLAESRQKDAQRNSWLEGQKQDVLGFAEFGHLADIICANWEDFSDLIPSQTWLKQRFGELEKTRNFIAHNRLLQDSEFERIEMYVTDWNRTVGL